MLHPCDQIRFGERGDRSVRAAAGPQIRDLAYQRCGHDLVVLAADFDLCAIGQVFWLDLQGFGSGGCDKMEELTAVRTRQSSGVR